MIFKIIRSIILSVFLPAVIIVGFIYAKDWDGFKDGLKDWYVR